MERITMVPGICHGKPTIRGLRYPVEMVLDLLASGMSAQEILFDYPDLEAADITSVLTYAAQLARVQSVEGPVSQRGFLLRPTNYLSLDLYANSVQGLPSP